MLAILLGVNETRVHLCSAAMGYPSYTYQAALRLGRLVEKGWPA